MNQSEPIERSIDADRGLRPDSLQRYVFCNYDHLLTKSEWAGWNFLMRCSKREHALESYECGERSDVPSIESIEAIYEPGIAKARTVAFEDAAVKMLLEQFPNKFFVSVAHRILRDHPDKVHLNLCRKCLNLCRTPRARQCYRCGFTWHDEERHE